MDIMVIGGGGREHCIIKSLKKNTDIANIYALPGNGGIAADAQCVNISAKDVKGIIDFAVKNKIDFAVIAPEDPLVLGLADELIKLNIPCFGPNANAAIIEGSKVFSKALMKKYGIPTAQFEVFRSETEAIKYLKTANYPVVVKADGLAAGKGVVIAENEQSAVKAVHSMMSDKVFGESGSNIVLEEFLTGPEVSVLAFTDGKVMVPMVSSMDHKRSHDGDRGLNTGGMGTVAPNPYYTEEIAERCMKDIFMPTMNAMNAEGRTFKGCLYFGLIITPNGPKVIEYNCRFGDPETQVVLPLLKTDLFTIMQAVASERLGEVNVEFNDGAACCVVVASQGYPEKYETGYEIQVDDSDQTENVFVYHAGTSLKNGRLATSGGRVLGVTAVAQDLSEAIAKAYSAVDRIKFKGAYYRTDIGRAALAAKKG